MTKTEKKKKELTYRDQLEKYSYHRVYSSVCENRTHEELLERQILERYDMETLEEERRYLAFLLRNEVFDFDNPGMRRTILRINEINDIIGLLKTIKRKAKVA